MDEQISAVSTASNAPKKKSKVKIIVIALVLAVVIGVSCFCISYFTSDSYKYTQAVKEMQAGNYEAAFAVIYEIYPEDVLLPFNGLYTNISIGDERTIQFENGEYTLNIPSDSSYESSGTYKANDYSKVVLTNSEDLTTDTFRVYKNYIYQCEDEDVVFDEEVDISNGLFNGQFSEKMTYGSKGDLFSWDHLQTYIFEDDGTYTEVTEQSDIGSTESYATHRYSGTYTVEDNLIILSPNDKEDVTKSFLVLDNLAYRIVYERDYTSDISRALR